jgi:hypothetical protein
LSTTLPALAQSTASLRDALPKLDDAAIHFSETYNIRAENAMLDRRRKALLLSRNVDRLADILDLPTLLSSAISTSNTASASAPASNSSSNATLNYASALDLNAHIRRLHALYPESPLISSVEKQAEEAMQDMATNLIASLKTNSLKLASAMRTISWLRRVAPELDPTPSPATIASTMSPIERVGGGGGAAREGSLGALFLVCRLANLQQMLEALEPLRELADQETSRLQESKSGKVESAKERSKWEGGQQTERYLKRYIEIFREQSFAIISMYRSIFPPAMNSHEQSLLEGMGRAPAEEDPLMPLPSALGTFPLTLVGMLEGTLRKYLPNVRDRSSRDSLLTQVLYCAGSLGRLGGDFSMILAFLNEANETEEEEESEEWVEVIRKHRVLAGRLELMVGSRDA